MKEKTVVIKSNITIIPQVVNQILEYFRDTSFEFDEDNAFKIKVVLNEMITNSVVHGNSRNENKNVTIRLRANEKFIEVKIIDQGEPFTAKKDEQCFSILEENSRGLLICHSFCNDIKYRFINGVGNAAVIKFYYR